MRIAGALGIRDGGGGDDGGAGGVGGSSNDGGGARYAGGRGIGFITNRIVNVSILGSRIIHLLALVININTKFDLF